MVHPNLNDSAALVTESILSQKALEIRDPDERSKISKFCLTEERVKDQQAGTKQQQIDNEL